MWFNEEVLFSTYVSSTCYGPNRSIIRSVLYKLYSQTVVCGNTRTTQLCVVVRVLPHTKSAHTAFQNVPDDGPMRSETFRANISAE